MALKSKDTVFVGLSSLLDHRFHSLIFDSQGQPVNDNIQSVLPGSQNKGSEEPNSPWY